MGPVCRGDDDMMQYVTCPFCPKKHGMGRVSPAQPHYSPVSSISLSINPFTSIFEIAALRNLATVAANSSLAKAAFSSRTVNDFSVSSRIGLPNTSDQAA